MSNGKYLWLFAILITLLLFATCTYPVYAVSTDEIEAKQQELEEIEKNTETMQVINKEKGDVGYCLFDTTDTLGHMLIQTIASFEGVIRIRKITS